MASFLDGLFALQGRVALITGASRGIGAAIARGYAQAGADVVITARSVEKLEQLAGAIQAAGREALVVPADITVATDVARLVRVATDTFGRIDVLVNNAGIVNQAPLLEISDEEWESVILTNLTASLRCARAVAAGMLARRSGKVINIVSVRAVKAGPRRGAYAASKAALLQLTRVMALEWAPFGVTANAIGPGSIQTEMATLLLPTPDTQARFLETHVPLRRAGETSDIVGAAIFLASPAADYITGQVLFVDGGWSIT